MIIEVTPEQIHMKDYNPTDDEWSIINEARDLAEKHFEKDRLKGREVIFNDWNIKTGIIEYHLK